jgi:hypothetical protein
VGALVLAPLAIGAPAQSATGSVLYECSGLGYGPDAEPSYPLQVVVDSDVPTTVPFGATRSVTWSAQLVATDEYRSWAADQGYTIFNAGPDLGMTLDGVEAPSQYLSNGSVPVPTTTGSWTWDTTSIAWIDRTLPTSALGHHTFALTSLDVGYSYLDENGPRLASTATCTLDPATPGADTVIDSYDVVAATTTTALSISGSTATATVTSNGAAPAGSVTFTVGTTSVSVPVTAGKAVTTLPVVTPGNYAVSATFVPGQPTQETGSVGTAPYTAPRLRSRIGAGARYRPADELIKARARVAGPKNNSASGRVTFVLKRNGVTLDNVTVRLAPPGVARTKFRGITRHGKYVVIAKYLGSSTYRPNSDRVRFTV